jgi:hypothetical protein
MNDFNKFRAWDGKVWVYKNIFLSHDGVLWYRDHEGKLNKVNWEISFCTGKQSKNGELIYERDIIKFGDNIAQIKFSDAAFYWEWITPNGPDYLFWADDAGRFKIIGNIYENPNFLL